MNIPATTFGPPRVTTVCAILCVALLAGSSFGAEAAAESAAPGLGRQAQKSLERRLIDAPDGVFGPRAWKRIARAVGDARVLYLGEPNHGSREIFLARNALIREMHRRLGFDVILLEAGIGEVAAARMGVDALDPSNGFVAALNGAMFGGWRTEEMRNLFSFALEQNIDLAGYDVQKTGGGFRFWLDGFHEAYGGTESAGSALEERFDRVQRKLRDRQVAIEIFADDAQALIREYDTLADYLAGMHRDHPRHRVEQRTAWHWKLIVRTLQNRAAFLRYMLDFRRDSDWNKRWAARDRMMAENIAWLAEHLYSGRKIIVIGHNFHVARHNEREEVMGEYLEELLDRPSYVLGAFSGRGEFADNSGRPEPLSPPDPERLDIKHVILGMRAPLGFLDFPRQPHRRFGWLDREIAVHDTFIDLSRGDSMKLRQHFDGLLLIKDSSLPRR